MLERAGEMKEEENDVPLFIPFLLALHRIMTAGKVRILK